jgi:hypothetical protein
MIRIIINKTIKMKKQTEIQSCKNVSKPFTKDGENRGTDTNIMNAKATMYSKYIMALKVMTIAMIAFSITACSNTNSKGFPESIVISSVIPSDISSKGYPASQANLMEAAIFAWQEFIALNWPARAGFRDSADIHGQFGDISDVALVWHTFRHKVEIYPGMGQPHGYGFNGPETKDSGYNEAPKYVYNDNSTNGPILPYPDMVPTHTPWINLDETNEIGEANMFAGVGDPRNNMMLYLAKANKREYNYVVKNNWYSQTTALDSAQARTERYVMGKYDTPPPNSDTTYVSLPYGTIEVKSAWRKLTATETSSQRFYTNTVRHYYQNPDSANTTPTGRYYYIDETYGLVALHIIQKTPTAPYFIFATFEQTDNILTADGKSTEDPNGKFLGSENPNALDPKYTVTNATQDGAQMIFTPTDSRLYYNNIIADSIDSPFSALPSIFQLPQGRIAINRRLYPISDTIQAVNIKAHAAIVKYNPKAVWQHYKLISVQYKPINKPTPGVDYHGPDSSTYYQSNSVVESDYVLQRFSGKFYTKITTNHDTIEPNSISDFKRDGSTANNVHHGGQAYLMGGCMGCHGNAANTGSDFSFILGNSVEAPSPTQQITAMLALKRLKLFFKKK